MDPQDPPLDLPLYSHIKAKRVSYFCGKVRRMLLVLERLSAMHGIEYFSVVTHGSDCDVHLDCIFRSTFH